VRRARRPEEEPPDANFARSTFAMNRERIAWLVSVVLIALLAFQLPGTLAQREDDYAFVRTLVDIHRQVANNYVEPVDEDKLRQGAIDGMMEQLDPFSIYVPPKRQEDFDRMLEGTFKGVGIQLDQKEDGTIEVISPIEGSPAFKAGVMAGDIILRVNGQEIPKGMKLPDVIKQIAAGPMEVRLRVRHATGEEVDLPPMTRQEIIVPTVKGYRRKADASWDWWVSNDPKIAYVRITQFTPDTYDKLRPVVEGLLQDGMRGMILDLRFNPGGRLDQAIKIVDMFVREGVIVRTKGRNRPEEVATAESAGTLPDFPMIVLVNEHSASASEIVAGSLMDNHRALVLGTRTYGKGSVQEVIPMGDKEGELKLTVAYYYLPSGRLVHKKKDATDWGVEPQINVPVDVNTEKWLVQQQMDLDVIGRPLPKASSRPSTGPTTRTTQPTDAQLDAAVSTMIGHIVLEAKQQPGGITAPGAPTTGPTTRPVAAQ
jgi:carboxyl-terminal processing protease